MGADIQQILIILGAGVIAGFINTMAGGGSFLTLAALEMAGMPIMLANGTNRVAIEIQNIVAVLGFRSKGVSDPKASLHFAIPALFGAILGAQIADSMPTDVFRKALGLAMILMLIILIVNPKRYLQSREIHWTPKKRAIAYVVFFVVGIYGGAIQAGVGFILIASLVMVAGVNLVQANSHKVFIIAVYTLFALVTFAVKGQVDWLLGLILAVGNSTGAWIASRLAADKGERVVRIVLMVVLAVLAVRYLGLIPGF